MTKRKPKVTSDQLSFNIRHQQGDPYEQSFFDELHGRKPQQQTHSMRGIKVQPEVALIQTRPQNCFKLHVRLGNKVFFIDEISPGEPAIQELMEHMTAHPPSEAEQKNRAQKEKRDREFHEQAAREQETRRLIRRERERKAEEKRRQRGESVKSAYSA